MPFLSIAFGFLSDLARSRIGQFAIVFAIAWIWSGWKMDASWRARVAAERVEIERLYQAEVARQAQAAREIAEEATRRVEEEMAVNSDLQEKIARYADDEKKLPSMAHCIVDDDFADVVRKLSPATRPPKPSAGSAKLRKAR